MTGTATDSATGRGESLHAEPLDVRNRYDDHRFGLAVRLAQRFGAGPGMRWVDIGCHNGSFARRLASERFIVTGTDVWDPELMRDSDWTYVRQATEAIPLPDRCTQVVSALEVIEHLVDTDRFLEELRRVTSPSALIVLSTPNINMLRNRIRMLFGAYPYGLEWKTVIHHVRLYNAEKLRSHLEEHKFDVLCLRGLHFLPTSLCRSQTTRRLSELLAEWFPTLCSTLVVVAVRRD